MVQFSKEAVHYFEGSALVLTCSLASGGAAVGQQALKFHWLRAGKPLSASAGPPNQQAAAAQSRLSIETLADYSLLRLADLRNSDSGAYTCAVSDSLGHEDKTTAQVIVNGKFCSLSLAAMS